MFCEVLDEFKKFKKNGISDDAAALLVLAETMQEKSRILKDFDHQICMGIRHALFGSGSDHHSINSVGDDIAEAIRDRYTEYCTPEETQERLLAERQRMIDFEERFNKKAVPPAEASESSP